MIIEGLSPLAGTYATNWIQEHMTPETPLLESVVATDSNIAVDIDQGTDQKLELFPGSAGIRGEHGMTGDTIKTPPASAQHPTVIHASGRLRDALVSSPSATDADFVMRAAEFAIEAHDGTFRKSGEPYVVHPIEVAIILAGMQLDAETVAAGLLHDVVEDSGVSLETLDAEFTPRVARLVDGVTKLGRLPWTDAKTDGETKETREKRAQAESLRKMFLAMIDDIGVVLIKLADRLHNMRTLGAMPREKQVRISQQTMEIYAPLANRLGIWQVKSELEDLAFRFLMPEEYARITGELERRGEDSAVYIDHVTKELGKLLGQAGIAVEMSGRKKHIYSIYRKMNR